MSLKKLWIRTASIFMAILLALPLQAMAQTDGNTSQQKLSKEELSQMLAPIALYPDELVAQILMASTYPLEVVQADRWAKSHKQSTGDTLAKQLEKENWDPSVKSMVNFPTVLSSMSEKLDLTTKIGDAFLSQQKDVMDTIQELRKKAYEAGNLKTTKEQKVVVQEKVIVIQPADPQVVYVPSYSPTVVYGTWMYPAYPPYYYYPPPPPSYPAYHFAAGVAVGVAWGYAWGNCNWHGGDVNYNVNQNVNVNRNIDRSKYQNKVNPTGSGQWKHNPEHRKNVAYKDGATAKKYGQSPDKSAAGRRDAARGYGDGRGGGAGARPSAGTMDRGGTGTRPSAGTMDKGGKGATDRNAASRGGPGDAGSKDRGGAGSKDRGGAGSKDRAGTASQSGRDSAFSGGGNGKQERMASDRGQASRQSAGTGSGFQSSGASRPSGGFSGGGGGGRGGGGGGRRR